MPYRRVATVCALVLAAACKGPTVPHPMTSESRYLCCNMHYEKTEISDVNYLKGTVIPLGTRVQILEVGRRSVKFQPAGHPPITLVQKYGKDTQGFDQYLDRIFLPRRPAQQPAEAGKEREAGADEGRRAHPEGHRERRGRGGDDEGAGHHGDRLSAGAPDAVAGCAAVDLLGEPLGDVRGLLRRRRVSRVNR
jgi:hypothetical protein